MDTDIFKQMAKEPWFNDSKEIEKDNQAYADETFEDFDLSRQKLAEDLYWIKPANTDIQDTIDVANNSIEEITNIWTLENSPVFPVLKWLYEAWHINNEQFDSTIEKLKSNNKDDSIDIVLDVVENKEVKKQLESQLNIKNEINENNFEESEFFKDSQSIELDKAIWELEIMLAENYINIPNIEWANNKKENLNTTFEITLNKILEKQSPDFIKQNAILIWEIRNETNINSKYTQLKTLHKEDLIDDAKKWWKKAKLDISMKKKSTLKEAKILNNEILEVKKQWDSQEKTEKLKQLNIEKQELINEWNNIDNFEADIFSWDIEIETPQNTTETNKENNPFWF